MTRGTQHLLEEWVRAESSTPYDWQRSYQAAQALREALHRGEPTPCWTTECRNEFLTFWEQARSSAHPVARLRERTGAGVTACTEALRLRGGDLALAEEYLQRRGLAAPDVTSFPLWHAAQRLNEYRCPHCGGADIEATAWIRLNTGEPTGGDPPSEDYWCPDCEEHSRRACLVDKATGECRWHGEPAGKACRPRKP